MRKLLKLGAALAVLALLFSGCPEESKPKPDTDTPAYVTGIALGYSIGSTTGAVKPTGLNAGQVITFNATVTGTPGTGKAPALNTSYEITVTSTVANAITQTTNANGSVTVTVADPIPAEGTVKVVATSKGKKQDGKFATVEWDGIVIKPGQVHELPNWVNSIALYYAETEAGTEITTQPASFKQGAIRWFGATVAGEGDFDDTYTLTVTSDPADLITKEGTSIIKVTFAEDKIGTITVTATATGKDEDGVALPPVVWTINVVEKSPFDSAQWILMNTTLKRTGIALDAKTTAAMPAANSDKRYVIFNNEAGATIDQDASLGTGNNSYKDVTVMYLNVPINTDLDAFKTYSIEARIRISKLRDSAPLWGSQPGQAWSIVRQGVIIGMMENPENYSLTYDTAGLVENGAAAPNFVGLRIAAGGQHRAYMKRSDNSYGSAQLTPNALANEDIPGFGVKHQAQLEMDDYVGGTTTYSSKREGFASQEYIYKVTREGPSQWRYSVYSSSGTLLFEANASATAPSAVMNGAGNQYLGIKVYGVEAEISDIKINYGGELVFEDPAVKGAVPKAVTAVNVHITADPQVLMPGDPENDWSTEGVFPSSGVTLTAEVRPLTATPRTVIWSVDTGEAGPVLYDDGAAYIHGTNKYGTSIFTATPNAGGTPGTFKFFTKDPNVSVTPETIEITTPALIPDEVRAHREIHFGALVGPFGAPQNVTWSVTDEAGGTTTAAEITAAGVFKASEVAVDTVVKVVATATGVPAVTTSVTITVLAPTPIITREWTFGADVFTEFWVEGTNGRNDVKNQTITANIDNELFLYPVNNAAGTQGNNWIATQASANMPGLLGVVQTSAGTSETQPAFGRIIDFEVPVRVSIIATGTGDNLNDLRYMWIKFGNDGPKIYNPNANGPSRGIATQTLGDPPTASQLRENARITAGFTAIQYATFTAVGQGEVTFGCDEGAARMYKISVETAEFKNWSFGANMFTGTWSDGDAGRGDATNKTNNGVLEELTLYATESGTAPGSGQGIQWNSTAAAFGGLPTGQVTFPMATGMNNASGALYSEFGKVNTAGITVPVRITINATNNGNHINAARYIWVKFGDGPKIYNYNYNGPANGLPAAKFPTPEPPTELSDSEKRINAALDDLYRPAQFATFSAYGTGDITFGCDDGAVRFYQISIDYAAQ